MDGMSKNPSHSPRVTHPCAPLTLSADVQNANDSKLESRPALNLSQVSQGLDLTSQP